MQPTSSRIALALPLLALGLAAGCSSSVKRLGPGSPRSRPEAPAERDVVLLAITYRSAEALPGKVWRPGVAGLDMVHGVMAADNYLFPVGDVLTTALMEEFSARYEGVTKVRKNVDYGVDLRVTQFELLHHGPGDVKCNLSVTGALVDREGVELIREDARASTEGPFDGQVTPDAVWQASQQVARDLANKLSEHIEREGPVAGSKPLEMAVREVCDLIEAQVAMGTDRQLAIAPFDFHGREDTEIGNHLAERIFTELSRRGRTRLVEVAQLKRLLEQQERNFSELADPTTAGEIGRILGVNTVVVGNCADMASHLELSVRWTDVDTARSLGGTTLKIRRERGLDYIVERSRR
ncbi:MAG: hypothetical protein HY722_04285 [Planctomycetes bacterium]|nr:hypothetical protein [Planctomycetota bacterium]